MDFDQGDGVKTDSYKLKVVSNLCFPDPQNMKELLNFFRKIDSDGDGEIAQEEANNVRILPPCLNQSCQ